jgi:phosphodiesterase/alkaline phosphatase D-like protein
MRKGRPRPPGEASRQSRRLAGKKVEFGPEDLERRMKKKAMQAVDILTEHEGIDQQALDDYARLFGQALSDSHIRAFTALFNWSLPDDFGSGNEGSELLAD